MAFGSLPKDNGGIPFSSGYLPNDGFYAIQIARKSTDGSGNSYGMIALIPPESTTGTQTSVTAAVTSTSLLASNSNRLGAYFYNDSTAILYLLLSSGTASTSNYTVQIAPGGFFELPTNPRYTGAIKGIWSAASGSVRITEMS